MKFLDAQAVLGIIPENQRDLSWDYLGKDKQRDKEMYPDFEFEPGTHNEATEQSALDIAFLLSGEAFLSEQFDTPAGVQGNRWFIKWPSGLTVNAGNVGLIWNSWLGHYDRLIANWNLKGRSGRMKGTDPEQQNPIFNVTIRLAEEYK